MNKKVIIALVIVVVAGVCLWLCPCRKGAKCLMSQGMMQGYGKKCGMSGDMGPMERKGGCPMGDKLRQEVLLAPDGGLFVVTGNKIVKYDKDLNVVKEVEVNDGMDMDERAPMGMRKNCPMMKGAMPALSDDKSSHK
ncbi:MAG: hypothetical protein HQL17_02710 [Candidatus Omnitrophica bacterium]|nr:hypothetical protein [Candidatus Omnitrophota bacterium]